MSEIYSKVIATGSYLPKKVLNNEDLSKIVDTTDEWIFTRTGIKTRHIADDSEYTSTLCINSIKDALNKTNLKSDDIDLLIIATVSPDLVFPSTACIVQRELKLVNAVAFDIQAACSGFIYGLSVANSMIKSGMYRRAIVVGAETLSRITDWSDRTTCVLFGDGAGCAILEATDEKTGILACSIKSDGNYVSSLCSTGGPSSTKSSGNIYMNGKEVFRLAVEKMPEISKEVLTSVGYTIDDIDIFIPHQANVRIIDSAVKSLGLDEKKVIKTIEKHGNISSACIPLALNIAINEGKIRKGNKLLLTAMGAGFTWGSILMEY